MSYYDRRILQQASALYVLIPSLFFAYGWLRFPFSVITLGISISLIVVLALGLIRTWQAWQVDRPFKPEFWKPVLVVGLVLVLWLSLSGTGGVGFQNDDYPASNALLKDLMEQQWPLHAEIKGNAIPIVYYVGYYLPAAGVGKLFGWGMANLFLYFWTLLGLVLAFAWFVRLGRYTLAGQGRKSLMVGLFFCLAGGLDALGYYLLGSQPFRLHSHIEWWADFFQYSSMTTLLFWVPQHAIAAWISIGVLVDAILEPGEVEIPGITLAASVLWSPFGVLGTTPYLLVFFMRYLLSATGRARFFQIKALLFNIAALWIGGVFILYIQANRFSFSIGFIWDVIRYKYRSTIGQTILIFDLIEFGLLGAVILLFWGAGIFINTRDSKTGANLPFWRRLQASLSKDFNIQPAQLIVFFLALVVLALLPIFRMGRHNDLVMRGSIPSLFVFFSFAGYIIFETSGEIRRRLGIFYLAILLVVALGTISAVAEISRSVNNYHVGAPSYETIHSTATLDELFTIKQRLGDEEAFFYHWIGK